MHTQAPRHKLTSLAVERADAADALANLELLLLLQQRHEGCIAFLSCRSNAQAVHGTLNHASLTGRAASALPRCAAREEPGPGPASADCRMWSTKLLVLQPSKRTGWELYS